MGVVKKYVQVPCSLRATDIIITYTYGRCKRFLTKSRVDKQKLCLAIIEFQLINWHPLVDIINAGFQPSQSLIDTLSPSIVACQVKLRVVSVEMEACIV